MLGPSGAVARRLTRLAAALALAGATSPLWPDGAVLGTFGRMLDSLAPHMLGLAALLAAAALAIRPGRSTLALGLAALITASGGAAGLMIGQQLQAANAAPPLRPEAASTRLSTGLDVIWLNLFMDNPTPPSQLAAAIEESGADLVILAEASPLRPELARLARGYPARIGCDHHRICEVVALSRHAFLPGSVQRLPSSRPGRLLRFALRPEGAPEHSPPLTVIAAHIAKPWFYGYLEDDRWYVIDRTRQAPGPVLVTGDFNSADWSRPMRALMTEAKLAAPAWPVATWPAWAGRFGVPIDHMLVAGGARLEGLRPWGEDLGSNHRGLRARVVWDAAPERISRR
ncbi:endonuclease/exonuclease/phosphatase family protein [Frigidibacter sp. MR17.14]|uniref:endonuclease/exonuclease/phosphatase family protein n=1 Tax=Frigidibacter sp. MR17.14 TaxID=3126509 RepID=UPI003012A582